MVEHILEYNNDFQIQNIDNDLSDGNELSYHHKVHSIFEYYDWDEIIKIIDHMNSKANMTFVAREIAQVQKENILSMRRYLKKEKLIMRASYEGYSFHTYLAKEFQEKASNYIQQSGIYQFINEIDIKNSTISHNCLNNIIQEVETTLNQLLYSKSINYYQYVFMDPKRIHIQLNYLHFVPDTSEKGDPLQPIIICKNGPTFNIALYLNRILWRIFNQVTGCQKFNNSDNLVHTLEQYANNNFLDETTLFVAFNINDICNQFSHENVIKTLTKFLHIYWSDIEKNVEGLRAETIVELVWLVLKNQYFVYDNKLYQQVHGGASGSLLTIPLACIYLFYGQCSCFIYTLVKNRNELFGRFRDDFFLTWSDSKDQLEILMNEVMVKQEQSPTILPLKIMIGTTINRLDLQLTNENGHLITKIYHDPDKDEYELPNKYDYYTNRPSSLLKAALKHAIRCCSKEVDFQKERQHIELCYLIRGFSLDFIAQCVEEFYKEFDVNLDNDHLFITIPYDTLRQRVIKMYENEIALKKQQEISSKNILRVPYPENFNDPSANNDLFNAIEIEFVPCSQTPLTINDYLVEKRPLLYELFEEPEQLEQQSEENKQIKEEYEQESLEFFLAADQYDQNYFQYLATLTSPQPIDRKEYNSQDFSTEHLQTFEQSQQREFHAQHSLAESLQYLRFNDQQTDSDLDTMKF
ncbi:unnamed protein product [Rotaria sordida]|uniref:Reverse transcriptase domain-containing protein n=1 Tax=Rotaria sordida TaxID=392033 RepID=A0A815XJN3_9BILA|nr:unnamed protein product [Rotaria sordida]CAF1558426.1 unnamed protein product [Rotaria sordida]